VSECGAKVSAARRCLACCCCCAIKRHEAGLLWRRVSERASVRAGRREACPSPSSAPPISLAIFRVGRFGRTRRGRSRLSPSATPTQAGDRLRSLCSVKSSPVFSRAARCRPACLDCRQSNARSADDERASKLNSNAGRALAGRCTTQRKCPPKQQSVSCFRAQFAG
jgi:hypothetical protein